MDEWAGALSIYVDNLLIRQFFLELAFPKGPNNTIREEVIEKILPEVVSALNLLDKQLTQNAFFCGGFYSMADAILTPMLDYVARTPYTEKLFATTTNLLPYLTRMKERNSGKIVFDQ